MRLLAGLIMFVLTLAACGSDQPDAPVTTTSSAAAGSTTTTVAASITQPPGASTATTTTTTTAAAVTTSTAGFATFGDPPDGLNWLQASLSSGWFLDEQPELCIILEEGEFGNVVAQNFGLKWSDGEWTLIWRHPDGQLETSVDGSVDGLTVTFEGESDGLGARGSVTCLEP